MDGRWIETSAEIWTTLVQPPDISRPKNCGILQSQGTNVEALLCFEELQDPLGVLGCRCHLVEHLHQRDPILTQSEKVRGKPVATRSGGDLTQNHWEVKGL